jgi:hypothetical protein
MPIYNPYYISSYCGVSVCGASQSSDTRKELYSNNSYTYNLENQASGLTFEQWLNQKNAITSLAVCGLAKCANSQIFRFSGQGLSYDINKPIFSPGKHLYFNILKLITPKKELSYKILDFYSSPATLNYSINKTLLNKPHPQKLLL